MVDRKAAAAVVVSMGLESFWPGDKQEGVASTLAVASSQSGFVLYKFAKEIQNILVGSNRWVGGVLRDRGPPLHRAHSDKDLDTCSQSKPSDLDNQYLGRIVDGSLSKTAWRL